MTDDAKQRVIDTFAEYDRTLKTYTTLGALHTLAQYWVENEVIIERAAVEEVEQNGPKWRPKADNDAEISEYFSEKDMARYMHDNTLIPMHRYSSIVMLFTTVERELIRLVENLEKEQGQQKLKYKDIRANSKLAQIAKYCEVFYGVRFVECPQYEALNDLQKVRDCIIHCLGDAGLSADKDYLVKLRDRRHGFFAHPGNDIQMDTECIRQFLMESWYFFISVFKSLGWEIATHWQGDKLEETFKKLKE